MTAIEDFVTSLLNTHRGGEYVVSRFGNSQMASDGIPLFVPPMQAGSLKGISYGSAPSFVTEDGELHIGIDRYLCEIRESVPYILVDNHNAVAHSWGVAWSSGLIDTPTLLVHVDQHSDLWPNTQRAPGILPTDMERWWEYAYLDSSVANYIDPLLRSGYIDAVVRIEGEYDLDTKVTPVIRSEREYILNIDLDFWAEDLSYIPREQSMRAVASLLLGASFVTIATSPAFISYERAYDALMELLSYAER